MSYQVLARKYRPQRFADVVGQEHVTQTLGNAIAQNRIAHAYLFCGPRGTGKTTVARIFAKCLNCTDGPKVDFDDNDPRCREITEGRSLDVLEIDGASNNGVEQVRELRDTVQYAPASSRFKIYIIDEVHMLTTAAFNALLKTLEEPPAHVKFLFATTEPEKVLLTILSRCQRFDLRRIPAALIVEHLKHLARLEKVKIDAPALYAIARGADGGMRDAESTLDQLISFCGESIAENDVLQMFGLAAQSQILDLARAVLAGELEKALRQLDELSKHGKDLGRLLSDLLRHFRNLLLFQISRGDLQLLEISEAEAAALSEQSASTNPDSLGRIMEVLTDCEVRFRDSPSPRILLEVALMQAIEARSAVALDQLLEQLRHRRANRGEAAVAIPTPAAPAASPRAPTRPESPPPGFNPSPAAPPMEPATIVTRLAPDLEDLWAKVVEAVGKVSPFIRGYLLEAHPVSFTEKLLTIGFDPEFADHLDLVDNAKNRAVIQTKLKELGFGEPQIKFIKADAPARPAAAAAPVEKPAPAAAPGTPPVPSSSPAPPEAVPAPKPRLEPVPFNKDDFKNDPLIQKALEVFKGQIVEVRA